MRHGGMPRKSRTPTTTATWRGGCKTSLTPMSQTPAASRADKKMIDEATNFVKRRTAELEKD
jgi:hypothetical protein